MEKQKQKQFSIVLDEEHYNEVLKYAIEENRSVAGQIRHIVENYLDRK